MSATTSVSDQGVRGSDVLEINVDRDGSVANDARVSGGLDLAELEEGSTYYAQLSISWLSEIETLHGCRVLARGIEVDRPTKRDPMIKVGYLLVDGPEVKDLDKAYWVNTVRLKPQRDYHGLSSATLLNDALVPEAENLFYSALLICSSRRLGIRNGKSHVTYLDIDGLNVSRAHSTFVKRLRCCFEADDPNADATRDLQLALFPFRSGERNVMTSNRQSGTDLIVDDHHLDESSVGRVTTSITHVPVFRSITAWALVHNSTECWYLRNGQWVSDAFDLVDIGPLGRRVDELDSEAFALTALHARALDPYWPVKDPIVAAVFVHEEHSRWNQTELIRALEYRLMRQQEMQASPSTRKRQAGESAQRKRKLEAPERVDPLGAPLSPSATISDVGSEED